MAVYVDPNFAWHKTKNWPYGSVSHMYADAAEELHLFAKRLGLRREWASDRTHEDSPLLHYDLNPGMRAKAVRMGAVEVSHRHGEPYRLRGAWCWDGFAEACKKLGQGEPTPETFEEWEGLWDFFLKGVVCGVDKERERVKKGEK